MWIVLAAPRRDGTTVASLINILVLVFHHLRMRPRANRALGPPTGFDARNKMKLKFQMNLGSQLVGLQECGEVAARMNVTRSCGAQPAKYRSNPIGRNGPFG